MNFLLLSRRIVKPEKKVASIKKGNEASLTAASRGGINPMNKGKSLNENKRRHPIRNKNSAILLNIKSSHSYFFSPR
jgi:hypothetical protein